MSKVDYLGLAPSQDDHRNSKVHDERVHLQAVKMFKKHEKNA